MENGLSLTHTHTLSLSPVQALEDEVTRLRTKLAERTADRRDEGQHLAALDSDVDTLRDSARSKPHTNTEPNPPLSHSQRAQGEGGGRDATWAHPRGEGAHRAGVGGGRVREGGGGGGGSHRTVGGDSWFMEGGGLGGSIHSGFM